MTAELGCGAGGMLAEGLGPMDDKESAQALIRDAIKAVDWGHWMQPPGNSEGRIAAELRKILDASDEASSWQSVMYTEYAFGNAEAGTYYPTVIPAIPILAMIVQKGGAWPRSAALEILSDWLFSFVPEQKYGWVVNSNLPAVDLRNLVSAEILNLQPMFEEIASLSDLSKIERIFIEDLLTGLDDDR